MLRQPASASAAASASSRSSVEADLPPSYSYSIGADAYQPAASALPTSYAPNPNLRLDFAFHQPNAASSMQSPASASASAVSSALPTSYAPSVSAALVASVAPSVRIYPAFQAMYKPSGQEQHMGAPAPAAVTSYVAYQSAPPQLAHAASVPMHISYPNVGQSAQPSHSSYSYVPSASHAYPLVVSPSAPHVIAAASSAPTASSIPLQRTSSLPSLASSPALPAAEMSSSESVHLANFQARVSEERWLMAEQKEADKRRRQQEAQRERERVKSEHSVSTSLSNAFGGLFSPLKKKGSSGSPSNSNSNNKHRLVDSMRGLSLDSKPPSKVVSEPPAAQSPLHHRHLLTDQFVRNEADPSQKMVRHLVVPTDDLVDLALRYDTTVESIRRHNRRVVFQHLDNVMSEYIHIPVAESFQLPVVPLALQSALSEAAAEEKERNDDYVVPGAGGLTAEELRVQSEMNRQFYAVRSFLSQVARRRSAVAGVGHAFIGEDGEAVTDCTEQEAEFYLQEAAFNVNLALAAYMDDLEWEARDRDDKKRRQQATAAVRSPASAGGRGGKASKPSSLALALAEAKQQRLSAIAADANAAARRDQWLARRLKKKYNMAQHGQMAAPLMGDADSEAAQQAHGGAALSDESRAEFEQSMSSQPAFSYYANSPSVASYHNPLCSSRSR